MYDVQVCQNNIIWESINILFTYIVFLHKSWTKKEMNIIFSLSSCVNPNDLKSEDF